MDFSKEMKSTQVPGSLHEDFKVLLFSDANNCMTQRTWLELTGLDLEVYTHFYTDANAMILAAQAIKPDLIVCPFLTKRIPPEIYENRSVPCLIIHPGPEGDRGMSALDWALLRDEPEWGVTLLQAEKEMDTGAIWSTHNFAVDKLHLPTKSSLYRRECVEAAMKGLHDVLAMIAGGNPQPRPLDYKDPKVKWRLQPRMMQADRKIDWTLPAANIARIVRAADSQPGVLDSISGMKYLLFGGHVESNPPTRSSLSTPSKSLLGKRHGAILISCGTNGKEALWITHLRKPNAGELRFIKLPATAVLPKEVVESLPELPEPSLELPFGQFPKTFQEIFMWEKNHVCYLWFDFYNGAMNTEQCARLAVTLKGIKQSSSAYVLVLMGGKNFFSNGINLNTIEGAPDAFEESWRNINSMDDFVHQVLTASNFLTVSVFGGNAGAGGVMAALASDEVWTNENTIFNPHYKAMALFGSEYWTYSLPKRVGTKRAEELTESSLPIATSKAQRIGLVDVVFKGCSGQSQFEQKVVERAEALARDPAVRRKLIEKKTTIDNEVFRSKIQECRDTELKNMQKSFASSEYNVNRHAFVFKIRNGTSCLPRRCIAEANGGSGD
ncbi:unnamed protein product [Calypogeia fissa]